MNHNLQLFISKFNKVRNKGFIKSSRTNSTGIGKTFEDALGIIENNSKEPDLLGFEIKSQRNLSGSYITLFTKSPIMPKNANTYLRKEFGSSDVKLDDIKVLHTSIFCDRWNTHIGGSSFSLEINDQERRVYIVVQKSNGELDKSVYYSFDSLEVACYKLKNLAYISADTRKSNGIEEFHFTKATIFSGFLGFDNFMDLLKRGYIMYDVRLGAYKMGNKRGKTHDHGSGFRIKKENMRMLYDEYIEI